jgi:hypothetical protein
VRIEGYQRIAANAARASSRPAASSFAISPEMESTRVANASGPAPAAGLDALFALQMVDEPLQRRRKTIRRGASMLGVLETMKADLLVGRVGEGRLNQLLSLIGQAREATEPGLDAVVDEIELRVRVELAKCARL